MTIETRVRPPSLYPAPGTGPSAPAERAMMVVLVVAFTYGFQATGLLILPNLLPLALAITTSLLLTVIDRPVLERIPLPPVQILFWSWMVFSLAWTENMTGTTFALRRDIPLILVVVVAVSVVRLDSVCAALVWSVRLAVVVTIGTLIIRPETRVHIDPDGFAPLLTGWHGLFPHKNVMAPFLVFGLMTIIALDRSSRLLRALTISAVAVLLVGSESLTGLVGAGAALTTWFWLSWSHRLTRPARSVLVAGSMCAALALSLAVGLALDTVLFAAGKDSTFSSRTEIWSATVDAWAERPLLGYGLNGVLFDKPVTPATSALWRTIGFSVPHAHNGFIDIGLQLGLIGLMIFAVLFATTTAEGLRAWRQDPTIGAWIVSVLVAQLSMGVMEDVFLFTGWLLVLALFAAILPASRRARMTTGPNAATARPVARR